MTDQENKTSSVPHTENILNDFGATKTKSVEPSPTPKVREPAPKQQEPVQKDEEKAASSQTKSATKKTSAKKAETASRASASSDRVKTKNADEKAKKEKKTPAQVNATTATPTPKKSKNEKQTSQVNPELRSSKLGHKIVPYVLILFALFLGFSLILNLICNQGNALAENPSEHMMGMVGYYICYFFFGLFGPAVFVLPLLLINLGIFWKKYVDNSIALAKILVSFVFVVLLGAVIHVFCLQYIMQTEGLPLSACDFSSGWLMKSGAEMTGGGVLGGTFGYVMMKYLNVIGSVIIGIFLLAACLFFVLGMTPQYVWGLIRKSNAAKAEKRAAQRAAHRAALRAVAEREVSLSEEEAEEAHKQAMMDEKIRKITAKQDSTQKTPANGAVEVVRPAPQKKTEADKLAPMPMPRLEPNDGTRPFVPGDVGRKMNEESRAKNAQAAAQPQTPPPPPNPAQNRDTAVDPIFPKSNESKFVRRVPKQDRNFDLNKVFLDLGDSEDPPVRKHAPIPPEVPLGTPHTKQTKATPVSQTSAETGTTVKARPVDSNTQKSAPAASAAQKAPPTATGAIRPAAPAATAAPRPAAGQKPLAKPLTTATPTKNAPSLSAVRPAPQAKPTTAAKAPASAKPVAAGGQAKPIFRQAQTQQADFGLSNEQFEQLEAQQKTLPTTKKVDEKAAGAVKAPAPKTATASAKEASKSEDSKGSATAAKKTLVKAVSAKKYVFPPISYLQPGQPMTAENRAEIEDNMTQLSETLSSFHVKVQEISYSCGPTVTRYEVVLAPGVRVRSVTNLADDIALALRSPGGVRIEAPIPGTNAVGIEIPNKTRSTIYLRDMIESKKFTDSSSKLSACLGADIAGQPLIFDIAKMPHLLVAGTTGSGKSVCINCIITSLLYRVRPDEVKLILIDPKKVEFSIYKNIPHLMAPVVTLPKDAAGALQAAVEEMERRFEIFETVGVRDLKGYNSVTENDPDMPYIPHIVIIIDELADLMMTARNEVETAICRIAQKARAAGMHLIIGTQRPSADVVTGLIKANVPSCIAFAVKSQIDSRVILDHGGAEALTGRGDMLFVPIGSMRDTRVQGAFVDDKEVERICDFIRATNGTAVYDERFTAKLKELAAQCGNKGKSSDDIPPVDGEDHGDDPKYNDAVRVAVEEGRISTSLLQRKLGVGYSRAAKLIDRMQAEEIVSPPDGSKPRSILITPEQYLEMFVDNAKEDGDSSPDA